MQSPAAETPHGLKQNTNEGESHEGSTAALGGLGAPTRPSSSKPSVNRDYKQVWAGRKGSERREEAPGRGHRSFL